jgi:hypothetical protein
MAVIRRASPSTKLTDEVGYHDLMADLRKPGCPCCHGSHRAAWKYLDGLLWEFVNDPGVRAGLRAARGFCREHSRMALVVASEQAAARGIAILYEDLLGTAEYAAAQTARSLWRGGPRSRRRGARDALAPTAACPACQSADRVADNYLRILARQGPESPPAVALRHPGRGLCFPHLATGLAQARSEQQAQRLLEIFGQGTEELRRELREFIRKQDYRFRHEGLTTGESSAWKRAVYRMVGEPPPRRRPER